MCEISCFFWRVVDSKIQVTQSLAYVRQSSSKFKLFSGLDGVATTHEKLKVSVCMNNQRTTSPLEIGLDVIQSHPLRMCQLIFMDDQPQNLSIVLSVSFFSDQFQILTSFWHLMCMSCKPDVFKLGACTLCMSAIMNLIPP